MKTKDFSRITKIRIDKWYASGMEVQSIFKLLPKHHTLNQLKSYLGLPLEEEKVKVRKKIVPISDKSKEKILMLFNKGYPIDKIRQRISGVPSYTRVYNIIHGTPKRKSKKPLKENTVEVLKAKTGRFSKREGAQESTVTSSELLLKIGPEPVCYLTGEKLDIKDGSSYHLDHIIPISRGGDNSLENCGLLTSRVNLAKGGMTNTEFIEMCKSVVEYNGFIVTRDPNYYDWDCTNSC